MKKTGVFLTPEELKQVKEVAADAHATPVMKFGNVWLHESAQRQLRRLIDDLAIQHGLPEPAKDQDGDPCHYGMDNDGQFTAMDDWKR